MKTPASSSAPVRTHSPTIIAPVHSPLIKAHALDHISDAVIATDLSYTITYWNHAAEKLYGWKKEEVTGKKARSILHTAFVDPLPRADWETSLKNMGQWRGEVIQNDKFGNPLYIMSSVSYVKDENNTVIGAVAVNRASSSHTQAERDLTSYKERLELAQEIGNIGIFEWSIRDNTVYWSDEQKRLLDREDDTDFSDWYKTIHPQDREKVKKEIMKCQKKRTDYYQQYRVVRRDGTVRWLAARGKFYYNSKGEPQRLLGVNIDISERKHIEDVLQFKAEVSREFSYIANHHAMLKTMAKLAVPRVADWCTVDLIQPDGTIEQTTIVHSDPQKVKWAKLIRKKRPINKTDNTGVAQVLRTGLTEYYPTITDHMLATSARSKEDLRILKKAGLSSSIIVPLVVRKKVIGAISFILTESKRHYSKTDLQLIEQIASRASTAIENLRLYETIENERFRLNTLVDTVPGVVWEARGNPGTAEQHIEFVSKHAEKMLGYPVENWLSTPNFWLSIVHPDDRERASREAAHFFRAGKGGISRFRWVRKDGRTIWVDAYSYIVKDKKGAPVGMRGVSMDVTERVELERRKDEFIGIASHELRTPLTSIKGYIQILERLLKKKIDPKTEAFFDKTNIYIDRLNNLINDLLDVSRIQAGKLQLNKSSFRIDDMVKDSIHGIQPTSPSHRIIFRSRANTGVYADRVRLEQVVTNLLSNAIKYSPNADKVLVTTGNSNNHVRIRVTDYGIGIPPEKQRFLFRRFYRVEEIENKFSGLGIGLYVASEIVKRHSGSIQIKSDGKTGSTFEITIPVK